MNWSVGLRPIRSPVAPKSKPGRRWLWRVVRRAPFYQPVETVEKMPDCWPVSSVAKQRLLARKSVRLKRSDRDTTGCWPDAEPPKELSVRYKEPGVWLFGQIVPWQAWIRFFTLRFMMLDHGSDLHGGSLCEHVYSQGGIVFLTTKQGHRQTCCQRSRAWRHSETGEELDRLHSAREISRPSR